MESHNTEYDRKFGHSVITWDIEHFCFETREKDFLISSSEFFVDKPEVTSWRMTLSTKSKQEEDYYFSLNLERLESSAGVDVVQVDLKLWLFNCAEKCGVISYKSNFEKYLSHDIELWKVNCVRNELNVLPLEICTLQLRCHMIINFGYCYERLHRSVEIGLRSLSEDLEHLYSKGIYHDLILRTKTKDFRLHKVICARSCVLADIIENSESEIIDLSSFDSEAMSNILAYLYSGNIDSVSVMPSLLIYDYAMHFKLYDIQTYYCPEEVYVRSVFEVVKHSFLWMIPFNGLKDDHLSSPLFTTEYMDATWKLSIYREYTNEHLSVFADVVEGTKIDNSCLHFAIVNADEMENSLNDKMFNKKLHLLDKKGKRFGFDQFLSKDSLDQMIDLADDTLKLLFEVEIHNDRVFSSKICNLNCTSSTVHESYSFQTKTLFHMFKNGKFTDVIIESDGATFKAHKCILAARSCVFDSMLSQMSDNKLVLNVKSNILSIILNYMYSCVYDNYKLCDIVEVYRAAEELSLMPLKEICSQILRDNLNEMPVCDVFKILAFSSEKKDFKLRKSALKLLYQDHDEVFQDDSWKIWSFTKPQDCS